MDTCPAGLRQDSDKIQPCMSTCKHTHSFYHMISNLGDISNRFPTGLRQVSDHMW